MALSQVTPRDRLQRLVDLVGKTLRNWWLIVLFVVVGGALSLAFAITRPRAYQSWSTVFYIERIQSNVLANREEGVQRNIGDRYRELLLARDQLLKIVSDPKLDPFPELTDDRELAIDKLRQAVHFEARGANAFRLTYTDSDPERAKEVTERLTKLLQDKDEALRNEQAASTVKFAQKQRDEAGAELRKREQSLAEFLAKHPEFVQDQNQPSEGASIRAIRNQPKGPIGSSRLYALERQKQRIQARLDAPPDAPPVRVNLPPSPERIAADQAVAEAQRELSAANRELEDLSSKYEPKHPSVMRAQDKVAAALQKLKSAKSNVPADIEAPIRPATPEDRVKLQKELQQLDAQIAAEQNATKGTQQPKTDATNWIVQLETEHAELRRLAIEQRGRVEALGESLFRAQIDASQKAEEQGGRLSVIDPAFKPVRPSGPGKTIFLMAGLALFTALGVALAIGRAVIDDRLYRRTDLEQLGIPVLAVIPHAEVRRKRKS
jgi:succinoglycan biosynthesis transport protein ExoP